MPPYLYQRRQGSNFDDSRNALLVQMLYDYVNPYHIENFTFTARNAKGSIRNFYCGTNSCGICEEPLLTFKSSEHYVYILNPEAGIPETVFATLIRNDTHTGWNEASLCEGIATSFNECLIHIPDDYGIQWLKKHKAKRLSKLKEHWDFIDKVFSGKVLNLEKCVYVAKNYHVARGFENWRKTLWVPPNGKLAMKHCLLASNINNLI